MTHSEILAAIAAGLGIKDVQTFVNDPSLFLSEPELTEVLKAYGVIYKELDK